MRAENGASHVQAFACPRPTFKSIVGMAICTAKFEIRTAAARHLPAGPPSRPVSLPGALGSILSAASTVAARSCATVADRGFGALHRSLWLGYTIIGVAMIAPPRIKTTVVGSYPVPDWLIAFPSAQGLSDAMRVVFHLQQQAGIDLVCDGELYRFDPNHPETNGMIDYFIRPMTGIRTSLSFEEILSYRAQPGISYRARPPGVVEAPIGAGALQLPEACAGAKRLALRPLKFTLTGPHMLAKTLINRHYPGVPDLARAIAEVLAAQVSHLDAAVVQVDEANLPGCPDEWPWAVEAMNIVLDAVRTVAAVHLCFGNYGGQSVQKGNWAKLLNYINGLHAAHIVLETAHRPAEELAVFRDLRPEIKIGLGVVDVKSTEIETPDQIAQAIARAETLLGPGRVEYINPDCGLWMLKRTIADGRFVLWLLVEICMRD